VHGSGDRRGGRKGLGAREWSEHHDKRAMAVRMVVKAYGVTGAGGRGLGGHVIGAVALSACSLSEQVGEAP
jgi:hypothetical protein